MTQSRWWDYVSALIGDDSNTDAARRAGFDKSAFTRWKKGARADPEFVVKLARAYGANVIEALVEAEVITEQEAALREVRAGGVTLDEAGDEDLLAEVRRRMQRRAKPRHLTALDQADSLGAVAKPGEVVRGDPENFEA